MIFSFKSFKGEKGFEAESAQDQKAKRKEQDPPERKEAYTRSLEQEVLQLRANEAISLKETHKVYAELTKLRKLMAQHGIEITTSPGQSKPSEGVGASSPGSDEEFLDLDVRLTNAKLRGHQIQVFKPSHHAQHDQATASTSLSPSPYPTSSLPSDDELTPNTEISQINRELDLTALGVNFILGIEAPCLPHFINAGSNAETGHALMASATLLHQNSQCRHSHWHSKQHDWQVPAVGIERLLQLSTSIPISEGEVTPVQAWDVVRQHPDFATLDLARLEALMNTLRKAVKCYGFGAVIKQSAFDNALYEILVKRRVS
ncbi:hypothetical protein E8E13_011057 [Curvularia kusanoi]|uniref:Uncharacterized protein n=1 Tax=Curvularia kusanoi TaxID=90978 RepID=A0A9P4W8X0_CURKU|nr:hypothetical protein E8E13_011057 [Curvularia kusanoi]